MWFETLLVFILFKFKKRPNIYRISFVFNFGWYSDAKYFVFIWREPVNLDVTITNVNALNLIIKCY